MTTRVAILLAVFALTAPALAGCIGGSEDDDLSPGSKTNGSGGKKGGNGNVPPPVVRTPLALSVAPDADWVKPGDVVNLAATPPAGATGEVAYAWSYGPLPAAPAEGEGGGHQHGGDDAPSGSALDTGDIAAGSFASLTLAEEGIFRFHCHPHPWMKFNATASKDLPASTVHVALVEGDISKVATYRFAPEEITAGVGSTIVFWNNGTLGHTATLEAQEPPLWPIEGASGPNLAWTTPKDGDYRVVVVAKDGATGHGVAETRVLVDSGRPDPVKEFDTKKGAFIAAADGHSEANPASYAFVLDYETVKLTVDYSATSQTPVPPQIVVEIVGASSLAKSEPGASGSLTAENLAPGNYKVVVTPQQGLSVDFAITIKAEYVLKAPAPGEGGHDDHGGHGGH